MNEVSEVVEMAANGQGNNNLILIVILLIVTVVFVAENIQKLFKIFGLRTNKSLHEEEQTVQLKLLKEELDMLKVEVESLHAVDQLREDKCSVFESDVSSTLKDIKNDLLDQQIDSIRIQILDFANGLQKRAYSREYFTHIYDLYDKYKRLIEDNNIENNRIELSMEQINKMFIKCQEEGF